jgi:PAS domain S-box-containing protein
MTTRTIAGHRAGDCRTYNHMMVFLARAALFGDDPESLRRISLALYAVVGPAFVIVLALVADDAHRLAATATVATLIVAGTLVLALARRPTDRALVFPASVVPIISCGIAFAATGIQGAAFVAVVIAPIAWSSVLFDGLIVVNTLIVAWATFLVVLVDADGPLVAAFNVAIFATITSAVAWVGFEKSRALRVARESARREEARASALLDAIPDLIARGTPDGRFTELRVPKGDSLPLPAEKMIGREVYEFLPEAAREPMRAAIARATATGEAQHVPYTVLYPSGQRSFESTIVRASDDEIVVVRHDATASEAAAREHAFLATLVENMAEAVTAVDLDGIVTTWSAGAERMYGWTASEALGRSVFELTNSISSADERSAVMAELTAAGISRRHGVRSGKDGRKLIADVTNVVLRSADGTAAGVLGVARDVTELEDARKALEASEARYRSIVSTMGEGVVVRDVEGRLVMANDAARSILGLTDAQIDGRESLPDGWQALEADGVTPRDLRSGAMAMASGRPVVDLIGAIREPGKPLTWIALNAVPLPTGGVVSTIADITARRLAEEVELEQARLQSLEQRMNEVELVMELDGSLVMVNDRAVRTYGYHRDELLKLNIRDLRAPETRSNVASQMQIASREGLRFETTHVHRDGSTFPVEVSSRGFEIGGRQYLHSLIRDVTQEQLADWQRRALEAEVSAALAEREAVLASSPVGITRVKDRRLVWANNRMAEIFGYSLAELSGASTRILYADDREWAEAPAKSGPIMASGSIFYEVQQLRRKDGSLIWVANTGRLLSPGDPRVGSIWTFQDVTEQHLAEQTLVESEERYRRLAEHVSDVIWTIDLVTLQYTYISPSVLGLRGLTVEEAMAEPLDKGLTLESLERTGRYLSLVGRPGGLGPPDGAMSLTDIFDQPCADGTIKHVEITFAPILDEAGAMTSLLGVSRDVTARIEAERERERTAGELRDALDHVRTLSGLLPICAYCHRIRNDGGDWERLESYISGHTNAQLSHGMCPECYERFNREQLGE